MQKMKNIISKAFDNILIKVEKCIHSLECFNNSKSISQYLNHILKIYLGMPICHSLYFLFNILSKEII